MGPCVAGAGCLLEYALVRLSIRSCRARMVAGPRPPFVDRGLAGGCAEGRGSSTAIVGRDHITLSEQARALLSNSSSTHIGGCEPDAYGLDPQCSASIVQTSKNHKPLTHNHKMSTLNKGTSREARDPKTYYRLCTLSSWGNCSDKLDEQFVL